jgi:hypothetical protein
MATFPLVLVGNIARIVAVATLNGKGGLNLESGWGHELLGFILFAGVLCLLVSTDQLLQLVKPMPRALWSFALLLAFGEPKDGEQIQADNELLTKPSLQPGEEKPVRFPSLSSSALCAKPILFCFAALALAEILAVGALFGGHALAAPAADTLPTETVRALDTLKEDSLPGRSGNWQRAGFEVLERAPGHPLGRYSRLWRYTSQERSAHVGIHHPFVDWKEVKECYEATGWTSHDRVVQAGSPDGEAGLYVTVSLSNPTEETYGFLIYQMRDSAGRTLIPPHRDLPRFLQPRFMEDRPGQNFWRLLEPRVPVPTYQLQVFVQGPSPQDSAEEKEAEALFDELVRAVPK